MTSESVTSAYETRLVDFENFNGYKKEYKIRWICHPLGDHILSVQLWQWITSYKKSIKKYICCSAYTSSHSDW